MAFAKRWVGNRSPVFREKRIIGLRGLNTRRVAAPQGKKGEVVGKRNTVKKKKNSVPDISHRT